ncbi:MAG: DUF4153 domain-containing protein [Sphingobacteriaceae bacterium]
MTIPSLNYLFRASAATFKRFPLGIIAAILCSFFACRLVHLNHDGSGQKYVESYYTRILMTCYLGMLLFIALPLLVERLKWSLKQNVLLQAVCLGLLLTYFLSLPVQLHTIVCTRFVLYALGLLFFVAFAPFMKRGEMNGFWQYNRIAFLRIFMAGLYSGVLYIGIAVGLLAIDKLFNANLDGKIYIDFWIIIVGVFAPWFFMAGLPERWEELDSLQMYPKGLKIFTQYILLTLVAIYGIILYSYGFKIVVTSHWPVGWVAYLVIGFSVVGMLSILLIWPIQNDTDNKWIKTFIRFFYIGLFPLILLLSLAIYKRIAQYGVTEDRYFVVLTAIWLAFIAFYFLIVKEKNIKLIPISLCLILFASSFGPWGTFDVSKRSQLRHLEGIFNRYALLDESKHYVSGKITKWQDESELSSVVQYLVEVHGANVMQPYLRQSLDSLFKKNSFKYSRESAEKVLKLMGLSYVSSWDKGNELSLHVACNSVVHVADYDDYIPNAFYFYSYQDRLEKDSLFLKSGYKLSQDSMTVSFRQGKAIDIVFQKGERLSFDLLPIINSLVKFKSIISDDTLPAEKMAFLISGRKADVKMQFRDMVIRREKDEDHIQRFSIDMLVRWKK